MPSLLVLLFRPFVEGNTLRSLKIIFRPPDKLVGGLRFYCDSTVYFFVSYPPSSRNGTQPKPTRCSEVCAIWKCTCSLCPKCGASPPYKSGAPRQPFFRRYRKFTVTLTAYIFGMKHDIDNRTSALKTTKVLPHRHKMSWTLAYEQIKSRPEFLPILRKFCILLYCQAHRSAKRTQPLKQTLSNGGQ